MQLKIAHSRLGTFGTFAFFVTIAILLRTHPQSDGLSQGSLKTISWNDMPTQEVAGYEILAQHCFECHGSSKQEGGLRLDRSESARLGGDSGAAFVVGKSDASRLIQFVSGKGDSIMPPTGERLSADQIAALANWIDQGAKWPEAGGYATEKAIDDHRGIPWSFKPVYRPELPEVKRQEWVVNAIDSFVLARLEADEDGPSPAREADRSVLIRRLSLDLLGLPPSDDDVRAFVADQRPDAYERLVDRYLASPHFGERWGRHWLDRTHYAESSGCLTDLARPYAWRWRDWVVDSLNQDLSFEKFTLHQIAGDLVRDANVETHVATGFFRNALTSYEPGIDLVAERVKTVVDRTSMVGAAWLGLTLGCAECHSHKYDPITQREFYRMYAFFDRIDDQFIDAPDRSPTANSAQAELDRARTTYLSMPAEGQAEWETRVKQLPDIWHIPRELDFRTLRSLRFAMVHPQADGSLTVDGVIRSSDRHHVQFLTNARTIRAVRVELLTDAKRFNLGPGRCNNGECILTGISLTAESADQSKDIQASKLVKVEADYCRADFDASDVLIGTDDRGWAVDQAGVSHAAVFTLDKPLVCEGPTNVVVRLEFNSGLGRTPIRFRIAVTDMAGESLAGQAIPGDIRQLICRRKSLLSDVERATLKRYFQSTFAANKAGLADWTHASQSYSEFTHPRGAECIRESWQVRKTHIHLRGDFSRHGDLVKPGIPAALELQGEMPEQWTRLDLAKWLVNPANPLTSRVAVNSLWQPLFGAGLVRTPGDFGNQGEPPTHPELLDWLADKFVNDDWSRKGILRRIVSSATYRQSSSASAATIHNDPQNVKLARQMRLRLDAEVIRDCVLDRAGLLDLRMGGPSHRMPQPDDDPKWNWEPAEIASTEQDKYRRGLYVAIPRTVPDPLLTMFDAPDGTLACPTRQRTNTPLQAIALMNDPLFVAAAQQLSKRKDVYGNGAVCERIAQMWTHCIGRKPEPEELKVLEELYHRVVEIHSVQNAISTDQRDADTWFVLARIILNLDETITRE